MESGAQPNQRRASSPRDLLAPFLSLVLGVLSVAALMRLVAGVPALAFGLWSLRRLNALPDESSHVVRWGRPLAVGGMVLGGLGCLLGVFGLLALGLLRVGEAGRRITCTNNLRQLGEAINLHQDVRKVFPGAIVDQVRPPATLVAPWLGEPYASRLSWFAGVLPFLERAPRPGEQKGSAPFETLFLKLDPEQRWDDPANRAALETSMRMFLCPSHPDYDPSHRPALAYYVGIAGLGTDAAALPREAPGAGFFGYERRLSRAQLAAGQAYTLMATETALDNGAWAAGGLATLRALDPMTIPYLGPGRPFGGMHPGGANLLMADGSVRFFTEKGRPLVLESYATLGDD